jgi:hypothetical protein
VILRPLNSCLPFKIVFSNQTHHKYSILASHKKYKNICRNPVTEMGIFLFMDSISRPLHEFYSSCHGHDYGACGRRRDSCDHPRTRTEAPDFRFPKDHGGSPAQLFRFLQNFVAWIKRKGRCKGKKVCAVWGTAGSAIASLACLRRRLMIFFIVSYFPVPRGSPSISISL